MTLEPNPFRWSMNLKSLAGLFALITSIWGAAWAIGHSLYRFAEIQTTILIRLDGVQGQLIEARHAVLDENVQRDKSLGLLKTEILPRIEKLEDAVQDTKIEAATTKQKVEGIKDDLGQIKSLAAQSLNVAKSHDDDIKATRRAVAPKAGEISR